MDDTQAELRAEYEALARRAGVTIPADRDEAFFTAFVDFRRILERLHVPRLATVETASVFAVESVKRGAP